MALQPEGLEVMLHESSVHAWRISIHQTYFADRLYTDDEVEWEGTMTASEAIATSLRVVTAPSTSVDASKSRRLSHLNALVKMWQKRDEDNEYDGLRLHEIMLW